LDILCKQIFILSDALMTTPQPFDSQLLDENQLYKVSL
jgi:hypothetical protein